MSAFLVGLITVVAFVLREIVRIGCIALSIVMQLINLPDEEKSAQWSRIFWIEFIISSICTLGIFACAGLMSMLAG
jgi:hypothetical protein